VRRVLIALLASLVFTGVAAGGTFKGSSRQDRLDGTASADVLYGYGGNDRIEGRGGNDLLSGGAGRDVLSGGLGDDRIASADGGPDTVDCGPGRDIATGDLGDVLSGCEVVSRRLSRDPYRGGGAQHQTAVEPDSFAYGKTIVAAFQIGRFLEGGGAANIGFATSRDSGVTWTTGLLPRLSVFSVPTGEFDRVSDPVVVYDTVHRSWMISTVAATGDATALTVSHSRDGITWSAPVTAARQYDGDYDKEWLACDNWRASPFRGRCYLSYMDFDRQGVMTRRSDDGGRTWSAQTGWQVQPKERDIANGVQPVVRPDGTLVVPFAIFGGSASPINAMAAVRSVDGGGSFLPAAPIATLSAIDVFELRVPPLPSVAIDGSGTIYLAWTDCRFVSECNANGIVVSRSRDGVNWSAPARVPTGGRGIEVNHFLPGLAATGKGSHAKLALAYYSAPTPTGCNYDCAAAIDAWISISPDGGRTWRPAQRLNSEIVRSSWLADTGLGRMLGDYISTSWVAGNAVPVFPLASTPIRGGYREEIFATQRGLR
jgi:RTX calcium-binding nonapeptide repeat (4 copies)